MFQNFSLTDNFLLSLTLLAFSNFYFLKVSSLIIPILPFAKAFDILELIYNDYNSDLDL